MNWRTSNGAGQRDRQRGQADEQGEHTGDRRSPPRQLPADRRRRADERFHVRVVLAGDEHEQHADDDGEQRRHPPRHADRRGEEGGDDRAPTHGAAIETSVRPRRPAHVAIVAAGTTHDVRGRRRDRRGRPPAGRWTGTSTTAVPRRVRMPTSAVTTTSPARATSDGQRRPAGPRAEPAMASLLRGRPRQHEPTDDAGDDAADDAGGERRVGHRPPQRQAGDPRPGRAARRSTCSGRFTAGRSSGRRSPGRRRRRWPACRAARRAGRGARRRPRRGRPARSRGPAW